MIKDNNNHDNCEAIATSSLYTPDYILDKALDIGEWWLKDAIKQFA